MSGTVHFSKLIYVDSIQNYISSCLHFKNQLFIVFYLQVSRVRNNENHSCKVGRPGCKLK